MAAISIPEISKINEENVMDQKQELQKKTGRDRQTDSGN